jgi:hypothetical protein
MLGTVTATAVAATLLAAAPSVRATTTSSSSSSSSGAKDAKFLQDVAHRSTYSGVEPIAQWEALPFGALGADSTVHVQNCFIALWQGSLYSSSRKTDSARPSLDSPFSTWQQMDWAGAEQFGSKSFSLVDSKSSAYSFFLLGSDGVRGVTLKEGQCGAVESTSEIYLSETATWTSDAKATSSADFIWVANPGVSVAADPATEFGVSQISIKDESLTFLPLDEEVTALSFVSSWQQLFIGSSTQLLTYTYEGEVVAKKEHEWIGGVVDTAPLDMSFDETNNALWIAEKNSIHKMLPNGMIQRFGQRQGSPNAEITSVKACGGYVWVGSAVGMARVRGDGDADTHVGSTETGGEDPWAWSFYGGHRYLPDNLVMSFEGEEAADGSSVVLVVCSTGVSLMDVSYWTLEEKAQAVETFQNPRHNRHGMTTQVDLLSYGDLETYQQACSDNDGLWTSMTGMGQVYRYLVTGSEAARKEAWTNFEAIEMMAILPGDYPHFPARSFATFEEAATLNGCSGDPWVNSTVKEGYVWKSTTSSDEIDGHLAFLPMLFDHIAQTPEEKNRVYALIEGITGGILDNDLYLIDPSTGKPTIWGFWNPDLVNDDPTHYSERGTNSIGILGYLASAYSITKDEKYQKTFWDLAINHGYIKNCLNGKIDNPDEDNHSDNELLFQAYHVLFYALQRLPESDTTGVREEVQRMVDALVPAIQRFWSIVKGEKSPMWLGIYGGTCGQPVTSEEVSDSVWTLRRWAIDFIQWEIDNTNRWDVTASPFHARDHEDEPLMRQIRPPSERSAHKWNTDPFVWTADNGMAEEMPSIWAYPYWLMRYNGLITAP